MNRTLAIVLTSCASTLLWAGAMGAAVHADPATSTSPAGQPVTVCDTASAENPDQPAIRDGHEGCVSNLNP